MKTLRVRAWWVQHAGIGLFGALALTAAGCSSSLPIGPSPPPGSPGPDITLVPEDAFTSPRWQSPLLHYRLAGNPIGDQIPGAPGTSAWWPDMDFWVYESPRAAAHPEPMLVVYLHGSAQTPIDAALGVRWNELADREDIVVVYPHGRDDGGSDGWSWGEASVFGRVGQLEAVSRITRGMQRLYGIGPERTFVAGTSSGAISATMMAALYTELYAGVMSVLGGSYNLSDPTGAIAYQAMGDRAKVVPAFLIHGTLDALFPTPVALQADTQWAGTNDLADNGSLDNSISLVADIDNSKMTVEGQQEPNEDFCIRPESHLCTGGPLGYESYPYQIHRYRNTAGRTIVEGWHIHGLAHNYPYGDPEGNYTDPTGPDVTTAGYLYFRNVIANGYLH